ncbi:MAG: PilZ domain-containing protein [Candidatus Omnitrophica bacterium]|nr:PilZ domain-containing protein [Candidatus Omnitrophota bacterium]
MKKEVKSNIFFYFALLSLVTVILYVLSSGSRFDFPAFKIIFFSVAALLSIFLWFAHNTVITTSLLTSEIKLKFDSLEQLLFDIRDGAKTFYREKRKHSRTDTGGDISAKILNKDTRDFATVLNISPEGALLRTKKDEFSRGEVLDLNMYVPFFAQPIDFSGRVVRVTSGPNKAENSSDLGIEYLGMTRIDREKLLDTIRMLKKSAQPADQKQSSSQAI